MQEDVLFGLCQLDSVVIYTVYMSAISLFCCVCQNKDGSRRRLHQVCSSSGLGLELVHIAIAYEDLVGEIGAGELFGFFDAPAKLELVAVRPSSVTVTVKESKCLFCRSRSRVLC